MLKKRGNDKIESKGVYRIKNKSYSGLFIKKRLFEDYISQIFGETKVGTGDFLRGDILVLGLTQLELYEILVVLWCSNPTRVS